MLVAQLVGDLAAADLLLGEGADAALAEAGEIDLRLLHCRAARDVQRGRGCGVVDPRDGVGLPQQREADDLGERFVCGFYPRRCDRRVDGALLNVDADAGGVVDRGADDLGGAHAFAVGGAAEEGAAVERVSGGAVAQGDLARLAVDLAVHVPPRVGRLVEGALVRGVGGRLVVGDRAAEQYLGFRPVRAGDGDGCSEGPERRVLGLRIYDP